MMLVAGAFLHLRRTLDSGQVFRWRWVPGGPGEVAVGVVGRFVVRLAQDARGTWLLSPTTPEARAAVARYMGSEPLGEIERALEADPVLARVVPRTRGIALLAQDPWEALVSFIVSQNSNIPRIATSIERMAAALGESLGGGFYTFPSPERLARAPLRTLRACSLGYRAPYVRAAARAVTEGRLDLHALRHAPEEDARRALLQLPGVGEKVADCVLLFGLGHTGAFPVDVWVRRAMERLYFPGQRRSDKDIREFARARFGRLAGYAQQHLFVYARTYTRESRRRRTPENDPVLTAPGR